MGTLTSLEKIRLTIEERAIWQDSIPDVFISRVNQAYIAIGVLTGEDSFDDAVKWLQRLVDLTPDTEYQFEQDFLNAVYPGKYGALTDYSVKRVLELAYWVSGSKGRLTDYEGIFDNPEITRESLVIVKQKIQDTSDLFRSYNSRLKADDQTKDPAQLEIRERLFKAVNEDNFTELESILTKYPDFLLDLPPRSEATVKNKNQFELSLLSMAYLRRAYFSSTLPDTLTRDEVFLKRLAKSEQDSKELKPLRNTEKKLIHPEETRTELDRKNDNEMIFNRLFEKADINGRTLHNKTILHLAANAETPPTDLLFFLLNGANPKLKDDFGKKPIDYVENPESKNSMTTEDEKAHFHHDILSIGIDQLFEPKNYKKLEQIMQEAKEDKSLLINQVNNTWSKYLNIFIKSEEKQGLLLYHLLTDDKGNEKEKKAWSDKIFKAGLAISNINKYDAIKYYEKAAELGNVRAMLYAGRFYQLDEKNISKALQWYEKYFLASKNTENQDDIISYFKLLILDTTTGSTEKKQAFDLLKKIFESNWDNNLSARVLSELIQIYSFLKNSSDFTEEEKNDWLIKIKKYWKSTLKDNIVSTDEGELLYRLYSEAIITKEDLPKNAGASIYLYGNSLNKVDTKAKLDCMNMAVELGYSNGFWILAEHAVEIKDYITAAKYYSKYIQTTDISLRFFNDPFNKIREIYLLSKKDLLVRKNIEIELIDLYKCPLIKKRLTTDQNNLDDFHDRMRLLTEIASNPKNEKLTNTLLESFLNNIINSDYKDTEKGQMLYHLTQQRSRNVLASPVKEIIEKNGLTAQVVAYLKSPLDSISDDEDRAKYYEVLSDFDDFSATYQLAIYHEKKSEVNLSIPLYEKAYSLTKDPELHFTIYDHLYSISLTKRFSTIRIEAEKALENIRPDYENSILNLLNAFLVHKNFEKDKGNEINRYEQPEYLEKDQQNMINWFNHFGNAETFLKLDQEKKQLISHRILEYALETDQKSKRYNPIAIELEKNLLALWSQDTSPAAKKLLSSYLQRKLIYLKHSDNSNAQIHLIEAEIQKIKPFYSRLFSTKLFRKNTSTIKSLDGSRQNKKGKTQ